MGPPQGNTVDALCVEVARALAKHPSNAKLLAALMEEVGELAKAMLQRQPRHEINQEALQVACVALRIVEEGDADFSEHHQWSDKP